MFFKLTQRALRLVPLLLLVAASISVTHAGKPGMRVYDKGLVDGSRLYEVICEDGKRALVRQVFDIQVPDDTKPLVRGAGSRVTGTSKNMVKAVEICAETVTGKVQCNKNWTIDKAAKHACQRK